VTPFARTRAAMLGVAIACAASSAAATLLMTACDDRRAVAPRDDHPNLLLITIDTLRPDRLGCAGNPRVRTPNLDALAQSGVLFETTVASSPTTAPSHATILTALSPRAHGVIANGQTLAANVMTLGEKLQADGYATGAVVSSYVLAPRVGLDRGFDEYIRAYERPGQKKEISSAESTYARVVPWLHEHAQSHFFLWVHLYDPHQPYEAPGVLGKFADPSYEGSFEQWEDNKIVFWNRSRSIPDREAQHLAARYDAEVTYVDAYVGSLVDALEDAGIRENTVICVTADHGETLGEHAGYFGHAHQLYETTLRVPLIFNRPGTIDVPPRRLVSRPARLLDVAPTCLELMRLTAMNGVEGRSLLPFEERAGSGDLPSSAARDHVVSETGPSERQNPESQSIPRLLSARTPRAKLIRWLERDSVEVFDLIVDPGEMRNLAGVESKIETDVAALLSLWEQTIGGTRSLTELDEETRERLRSLGYID
jgi:choline-sulfatase